jgi:hypothetical protein
VLPVPESKAEGLPPGTPLTTRVADLEPRGAVKVTLRVQLVDAASEAPAQVSSLIEKLPLWGVGGIELASAPLAEPPPFVTVKTLEALLGKDRVPKLWLVGLIVRLGGAGAGVAGGIAGLFFLHFLAAAEPLPFFFLHFFLAF